MSIFIKETDLVDVKIYHRKVGHRYVAHTQKEFGELGIEEEDKYQVLSVKMKVLTWGLYNKLQEDAMVQDETGNPRFNVKVYKESRLNQLIKEWDVKKEDGSPVPVTSNYILHLSPDIAETILRAYDEISFIGDEEEGK